MAPSNQIKAEISELDRLRAELAQQQQLNADLKAQAAAKSSGKITFKAKGISEGGKGCLSAYGLGRYPVTLYKSQWEVLIKAIKAGEADRALVEFASVLTSKG